MHNCEQIKHKIEPFISSMIRDFFDVRECKVNNYSSNLK